MSLSDLMKQLEESRNKLIRNRGETISESAVYCPYCTKEISDIWDYDLKQNGEEEEIHCGHCERYFIVSSDIVYSTRKMK